MVSAIWGKTSFSHLLSALVLTEYKEFILLKSAYIPEIS